MPTAIGTPIVIMVLAFAIAGLVMPASQPTGGKIAAAVVSNAAAAAPEAPPQATSVPVPGCGDSGTM